MRKVFGVIIGVFMMCNVFAQTQGNIPLHNLRAASGANFVIKSGANGKAQWVKDTVYYTYADGILSIQDNSGLYTVDMRDTLFGTVDTTGLVALIQNVAPLTDSLSWAQITNKPVTFTPTAHLHSIVEVNGLLGALDGKSDTSHVHPISDVISLQDSLNARSKLGHTHVINDVAFLQDNLNLKSNVNHNHDERYYTEPQTDSLLLAKSDTSHTHTISNIQGLQDSLNARPNENTATIQAKRPLKTIETQSLEGNGNIDLVKADVGLSNVDNTSDVNKPISTATQTALNTKLENVTGTLPISTSGTGVTRNISIATANGSTTGALTGTDWTTFNNKVGGTGAAGQVSFFTGSNTLSGDNNFFWDNTSKRLGLGTSTPERVLNVVDPSNPQLRLTRAQGVSHTDLQSLVNGDFSILPSFRRVGLFTNNPQDLPGWGGGKGLHIYDSGNIPFLYLSSPNNWGGFGLDNTRCYFYTRKGLRFYYNSVAGELNTLSFFNQTSGSEVKVFEVNALNQAVFGTSSAALSTRLTVQGEGATNGTFSLQVHNSTNASNSLIVRDDGNVGIGTNAPTEKLQVTGNIRVTNIPTYATTAAAAADGALTAGSFFKVSNGNGTSALHIKD